MKVNTYHEEAKKNYMAALDDLMDKFKYAHKGFRNPPYLLDFIAYISWKEDYINNIDKEPEFIDWVEIVRKSLDLIGELLKEKKVKAEYFEIEEYEKPRKVIKKFGNKEFVEYWDFGYKIEWLDPCKIEDKEELEKKVEEWKRKTLELYKYVLEKYGQDEANSLLDILEIVRSDCYEGEIRIE